MNLKDKCEELDISLREGKKRFGLTHWNQPVPEDVVETESKQEDIAPEEAVELIEDVIEVVKAVKVVVEDVVDMADKLKSIKGLGTKSPFWSELRG
jgi:hypothetical protein